LDLDAWIKERDRDDDEEDDFKLLEMLSIRNLPGEDKMGHEKQALRDVHRLGSQTKRRKYSSPICSYFYERLIIYLKGDSVIVTIDGELKNLIGVVQIVGPDDLVIFYLNTKTSMTSLSHGCHSKNTSGWVITLKFCMDNTRTKQI